MSYVLYYYVGLIYFISYNIYLFDGNSMTFIQFIQFIQSNRSYIYIYIY